MIGKDSKYSWLKVQAFEFPKRIDKWELEIKDERHFIEFLLRNLWVQKRIGIKFDKSNGLFPDVKGEIFDGSGDKINVEVEYWAENYKSHGHKFGGCDLILSFFRKPQTRIVRGVPVWSFYVGEETSRNFKFSLLDDINFDFSKQTTNVTGVLLYKIKKGKVICISCNEPFSTNCKTAKFCSAICKRLYQARR